MIDYCTKFPEGWWAHCCEAHDLAYAEQIGQVAADAALWQCVATSGDGLVIGAASTVVACVMWVGVRLFGKRYYRNAAK